LDVVIYIYIGANKRNQPKNPNFFKKQISDEFLKYKSWLIFSVLKNLQ